MTCRSEPADLPRVDPALRQPRSGGLRAVTLVAMLLAPAGCQTANYSATRLPEPLRAAAAQPNSSINLARIAGHGANSSQIGAGDLLDITIASGASEEQPEPVQSRVSHDGTVSVPLIGPVTVAGVEPFQAEQRVAATAVERGIYRQPYVTLTVAAQAVNRVTVLGAVAEPGVHELPRGASDLVGALGGRRRDVGGGRHRGRDPPPRFALLLSGRHPPVRFAGARWGRARLLRPAGHPAGQSASHRPRRRWLANRPIPAFLSYSPNPRPVRGRSASTWHKPIKATALTTTWATATSSWCCRRRSDSSTSPAW